MIIYDGCKSRHVMASRPATRRPTARCPAPSAAMHVLRRQRHLHLYAAAALPLGIQPHITVELVRIAAPHRQRLPPSKVVGRDWFPGLDLNRLV